MKTKENWIGRYRIVYWEKQSPEGHSGWIVQKYDTPDLGFPDVISKHETKEGAEEAARRYAAADDRRLDQRVADIKSGKDKRGPALLAKRLGGK